MTVHLGLEASYAHDQNGMTRADMVASRSVADRLNEVIIFRSTGPWSKRWLERNYPSKNFHVKGKSSDWGPHAGLVPRDGLYSKVGFDTSVDENGKTKAQKGSAENKKGLDSGFAGETPLVLSRDLLDEQFTRAEGKPPRTALQTMTPVPGSPDFILTARRSGDQKLVAFRAVSLGGNRFEIRVYPGFGNVAASPHLLLDGERRGAKPVPFLVMTSNEVGAGRPMTGDYDLFCVCPSWGDYGNRSSREIAKPGIQLVGRQEAQPGLAFGAGKGMDSVLDPRLHTMGSARTDFPKRQEAYAQGLSRGKSFSEDSERLIKDKSKWLEHEDMGNLTPRILRCINALNAAMGATGETSALRRVHHNAESHRFRAFGALTEKDMLTRKDGEQYGDGFPLTVFQPATLYAGEGFAKPTARYADVCTLESLDEFREYVTALSAAGFYVPKNWIWNVQSNMGALRERMAGALSRMWGT